MTNDVVSNGFPQDVPPHDERLQQLAQQANEAHVKVGAAATNGLICALAAGQALIEAHQLCPRRKWSAWMAANFKGSRWTAYRYMAFAKETETLGLSGATLHQIPPEEAGCILKKLMVRPSGKKRAKSRGNERRAAALPRQSAPSVEPVPAAQEPASRSGSVTNGQAANPFPQFVHLFEELIAGLETVMNGDDCHDGPFAELLLMDLRTPYADLLEYVGERDELKQIQAEAELRRLRADGVVSS